MECRSSITSTQHPEDPSLFSETMVGFHGAKPPAVPAAYDFSSFKAIVDVGRATGNHLDRIPSGPVAWSAQSTYS